MGMFSRAVACALRRGVVAEFDEEHRALRIRGALVGAIINRPPVFSRRAEDCATPPTGHKKQAGSEVLVFAA